MNHLVKKLFALCTSFLLLVSCNEDVHMIDGFTETAVVYGLLDQSENTHYLRINRAFIGPGNWLDIAKIPDSSYFDAVNATITEELNGTKMRVWKLQDTLIQTKSTQGIFYAPTQKLYYFSTDPSKPLLEEATYALTISLNNGALKVEGKTRLVSGISTNADSQNFRFSFAENPGEYLLKSLTTTAGNAHVLNALLRVSIDEITKNKDTNHTSFDWNLGEQELTPGKPVAFTINGKRFYESVRDHCNTGKTNINQRKMKAIEIIVTGGSQDLHTYITVNKPSSSLTQSKPTFTNLKASDGHRVIGIFSSRQTYRHTKFYINSFNPNLRMMDLKSVIELCKGPITGTYLFCSQHPFDNGQPYACQ